MTKRCCVTTCRANHASQNRKVRVFRLPSNPDERKAWINAIPTAISDRKDTVICSQHFPVNFETVMVKGKTRQKFVVIITVKKGRDSPFYRVITSVGSVWNFSPLIG